VADRVKTAQELWRVLKPGGRIVIQEPDIRTFSIKLMALGEKLLLMRSHFLPPKCIATLFDYPSAKINIDSEGLNIWIVVNRI
jgi:demethylmenaquinone methyltransferase/2-methoxy-6-polyprenyl-1,4-benzoquinol methylase